MSGQPPPPPPFLHPCPGARLGGGCDPGRNSVGGDIAMPPRSSLLFGAIYLLLRAYSGGRLMRKTNR